MLLVALLHAAVAETNTVFPTDDGWGVMLTTVSESALPKRVSYNFYWGLHLKDALNANTTDIYIIENHRTVKSIGLLALPNGVVATPESLVGNATTWSFCDGTISPEMDRHCYTGDPVLSDLECDDTLLCAADGWAISMTSTKHKVRAYGPITASTGMLIDIATQFNADIVADNKTVVSLRAAPSLRVKFTGANTITRASVWVESNKVDTAGAIVICTLVVITLAHLTRHRPYRCAACKAGFRTVDALVTHCLATRCFNNACGECGYDLLAHYKQARPGERRAVNIVQSAQNNLAEVSIVAHDIVIAPLSPRSYLGQDSGIDTALRMSFGLIATAAWALSTQGEGALVAEVEMGSTKYIALASLVAISLGAVVSWRYALRISTHNTTSVWAHMAYLTCEVLLLATLAYSIPKSYGASIVVASLFLTGLGCAAITGRTMAEIAANPTSRSKETQRRVTFTASDSASTRPSTLTTLEKTLVFLIFANIILVIISVMIFPMLIKSSGLTFTSAWFIAAHLTICVTAVPLLDYDRTI